MKILALVAIVLLAGCSTPEPKIITKEVKVAVPVPCKPNLGPRPALMTKDQMRAALSVAGNFDDKVKILTTQALLYMGWVPVLEAGLGVCGSVSSEQTNSTGD